MYSQDRCKKCLSAALVREARKSLGEWEEGPWSCEFLPLLLRSRGGQRGQRDIRRTGRNAPVQTYRKGPTHKRSPKEAKPRALR